MKRYAATFDCYIYAENDEQARKQVEQMENKMKEVDDNYALCIDLREQNFGELKHRKVAL